MNQQIQLIVLGFILVLLIILSLTNIDPIPYHDNSVFTKEYPFEGMSNYNSSPVESSKESPKKVKTEGFQGLQSSPFGQEKPLDVFSQLNASNSCTPSPYSNSKGYLCLDDNAKQLLLTRGGNQAGNASQIGNK